MSSTSSVTPTAARQQYCAVLASFVALGFHVGVWAVQLAELAAALRLSPGALGLGLTTAAAAGLLTLFVGGLLADRLGRRPVMPAGSAPPALWRSRSPRERRWQVHTRVTQAAVLDLNPS